MNIEKRLEALEAAVSAKTIEPFDIVRVIIRPDRTIGGALRRNADGHCVSVSDEELAAIRRTSEQ